MDIQKSVSLTVEQNETDIGMSTLEERADSGDNNNNSSNNNIESNVTNMRHLTRLIYDMSKYTILITFAVISSITLIIIPI